jgi:hypothetical protein
MVRLGPISNGRLENRDLLATCFELTSKIRLFSRDSPSPLDLRLFGPTIGGSSASGSR